METLSLKTSTHVVYINETGIYMANLPMYW